MTPFCERTRKRLAAYAAEELTTEERRALRDHLRDCASCRDTAVASDALFLFAGSGAESVLPTESAKVLEAVRAGIALQKAESRLETPARRRRWAAAATAAAALALTLLVPGAPRLEAPSAPSAPKEAVRTGLVPAATPDGKALEETGGSGKYPADATIYDWNPGAGQPRVVWIVDRSIDI
jgi:predicted anti-sigma-YlaC factor YlaD